MYTTIFYVEEGADVIIIAGCGVHSDGGEEAAHNGIHRFFVGKNARVLYQEKHIGTGTGAGQRKIDPVTEITLDEGACMEIDTTQISGVTRSDRSTTAVLSKDAKLIIHERLLTDGSERANSDFSVTLEGEDSGVDLISRSVARGIPIRSTALSSAGTAAAAAIPSAMPLSWTMPG